MELRDYESLGRLLAALDECDIDGWDRQFLDSLEARVENPLAFRPLTARQSEELNRIEDRYL